MCRWPLLWNDMHWWIGKGASALQTLVPRSRFSIALAGTIGLVLVSQATVGALAQQGPRSATCTAFMAGKVVGTYNCLVGRDLNGAVNFIQWEDGTASTSLGGWQRAGNDCFAASEESQWKICSK
jgi:hypothetical protein